MVPFGLSHELKSRYLVEMHYVAGVMGELIGSLVGDEYALDWVQVDKALILGKLGHVELDQVALEADQRVESLIGVCAGNATCF